MGWVLDEKTYRIAIDPCPHRWFCIISNMRGHRGNDHGIAGMKIDCSVADLEKSFAAMAIADFKRVVHVRAGEFGIKADYFIPCFNGCDKRKIFGIGGRPDVRGHDVPGPIFIPGIGLVYCWGSDMHIPGFCCIVK